MRAVIFREHGGPEKLEFVDNFPEPTLGDHDVLVRVEACALNHLDIWVRQGLPALKLPLPHISGCDISGQVAALGRKVNAWQPNDAVVVAPGISCQQCQYCVLGRDNICVSYQIIGEHIHGGYAEFVKVPARNLARKPSNISFEQAAAYPLTFLTSWHMLITQGQLKAGQSVLVLGAGSGIGVAAIQIAKWAGAHPIIAMASSQAKLEAAKYLGADTVFETTKNFYREILKLTDGQGVDVVFEHIGPDTMPDSIRSTKRGGIIVTCGATTGAQAPLDLRYFYSREIRLQGSIMGASLEFQQVTELVAQGKLKPIIDSTFPLEKARNAQEKMLSRNFFGKIILKP